MESDQVEIERGDTGIRILYSVLFAVINNLVRGALWLIIVFELGYTLITMRPPATRVRSVANSLISYSYRIQRWLAHTSTDLPFPFTDLPDDIHPIEWPYEPEADPESEFDDPELEPTVGPA